MFDFDGVIIDSHDAHRDSWFLLAGELGRTLTAAQFAESFGMRNESIIPRLFGWADEDDTERVQKLGDRKEELYRDILRCEGLEPLPGVRDLLDDLDSCGIPFAVGSSTPRVNIQLCLELCGFEDRFYTIVGAEDVSRGKPDPEVFLRAAAAIGAHPARCVVFEDAHVGIGAARSAGMKSIAVTTTHPRHTFGDAPDRIVDSLEEIRGTDIVALIHRVPD